MRRSTVSWISAIGTVCLGVVAVGGIAIGSIPGPRGYINACANNSTGALRVIDTGAGQHCNSNEKRLAWNVGPSGPQGIQEFPTSGTWTAPSNVTQLEVELIGGGGGGGCGDASNPNAGTLPTYAAGGGGGSGAYLKTVVPVVPGTTYTVQVATAAPGACNGDGTHSYEAGSDGGDTAVIAPGAANVAVAGGGGGGGAPDSTLTCDAARRPNGPGLPAPGTGGVASPRTGIIRDGSPGVVSLDGNGDPYCFPGSGGRTQAASLYPDPYFNYGQGGNGSWDFGPGGWFSTAGRAGYAILNW